MSNRTLSSATIKAGPLTIYGAPTISRKGLFLNPDGYRGGWDGGATMTASTVKRPQAHGDFDADGYLGGRLMPLSGRCLVDDVGELEVYRDAFIGLGADGSSFRVEVERNGRTQWARARVATGSVPSFDQMRHNPIAEWDLTWWFPNPMKYGSRLDVPPANRIVVDHEGNFPASPRIRITGSHPGGYTIYGPSGRQIIITRPVVPGIGHEFDLDTGRLYIGGVRTIRAIAQADLFTLQPYSTTEISVSDGLFVTLVGNHTFV